MKNHINKVYYTPYQLKLSPEIEKIIEISDPVYTFNEVFHHIALNKHHAVKKKDMSHIYIDGTKITANANKGNDQLLPGYNIQQCKQKNRDSLFRESRLF